MGTWLAGLAAFFVAIVMLDWCLGGALVRRAVGFFSSSSVENSPEGGRTHGVLQVYFDKITELDAGGYDSYFATVTEPASTRFVQVSAGAPPGGSWGYQFDLPLHDWALPHKGRIELEARSRGLKPTTTSNGGWEFLDIDFTDRDQHEDFVRWVVTKVFELSEELEFEITWG